MGRLPGVVRPCIATPLPRLGGAPGVLVDAGANAECTPAMLVQFAQMGAAYAAARYGVADPTVGLLSIGEEPTKGTPLVKETHALLAAPRSGVRFVGNVEGRDLLACVGRRGRHRRLHRQRGAEDARGLAAVPPRHAARRLRHRRRDHGGLGGPVALPAARAAELDPENTGGAMLLGVDGVCVISHGSSSATAMFNAIRVAHELATGGLVDQIAASVTAVNPD